MEIFNKVFNPVNYLGIFSKFSKEDYIKIMKIAYPEKQNDEILINWNEFFNKSIEEKAKYILEDKKLLQLFEIYCAGFCVGCNFYK